MTTLPTYRIEAPDIIEIKIETQEKDAEAMKTAQGLFLVGPDGTVNLRDRGSVRVAGSTIAEAASILEKHLAQFVESPKVSVRVSQANSKVYYVITAGGDKGDNVVRVPITGNETVLDALAQIQGIVSVPLWSQKIWISRPAAGPDRKEQTLPVDLKAIITCNTSTNYQIMPGDRLFIGP